MKWQLTASVVRVIDFLLESAIKFMRICYLSMKKWGKFTDNLPSLEADQFSSCGYASDFCVGGAWF